MPKPRKKPQRMDISQIGKSLVDMVTGSQPEPTPEPESQGIITDELLAILHKPRRNGTAKAVAKRSKPETKKNGK